MKDIVEDFGRYAGKLWQKLDTYGYLTKNKAMKTTNLKKYEFYAAVGWLARENKINKKGDVYKLGKTNLVDNIGKDAGKIWTMLQTWNEADPFSITKLTGLNEEKTYNALGWLAREGKIKSEWIKPVEPRIRFRLK